MSRLIHKPYEWFESFVKPGDDLGIKGLYRLFLFALLVMLIVFAVDILLTVMTSTEGEPWHGVFGDFFGGVVNPFLTFLTFMGLLLTVVVQKVELRDSREEMRRSADALTDQVVSSRKQSFETTFLKLLELHSALTRSIDLVLKNAQRTVTGQDSMERLHMRLKTTYKDFVIGKKISGDVSSIKSVVELKQMYVEFWKPTRKNLHTWHRSIAVILAYIKSDSDTTEPYLSMLSAQLSEYEKILVYYHISLFDEGLFKSLVLELDFLKDLPLEMLLHPSHTSLSPKVPFL